MAVVRVLVAVPRSELQSSWPLGQIDQGPVPSRVEALGFPPWLSSDFSYAPVPLGRAGRSGQDAAAFSVRASEDFAVRAYVDEELLDQLGSLFGPDRVFSDPNIEALPLCDADPARGTTSDVEDRLQMDFLYTMGFDGTGSAVAIMDTGISETSLTTLVPGATIDSYVHWPGPSGNSAQPGQHPSGHGTMCAYGALIAAPEATLLDYPILNHPDPLGGSILGGTLSNALSAYSHLLGWWAVALGASRSLYRALVVSNSWGVYNPSWDFPPGHPGRYIDNPAHPFNQIVSVLSSHNADILFAAGNCGSFCPSQRCAGNVTSSICGANAHPDVICVGGVDIDDDWVGYSSEGPGIAGMDHDKPDIAAYTHFLGSEVYGPGSPDSGTSAACPVAAGCVAALRSRFNYVPPGRMAEALEQSAKHPNGNPGWTCDLGHGIIDPVEALSILETVT